MKFIMSGLVLFALSCYPASAQVKITTVQQCLDMLDAMSLKINKSTTTTHSDKGNMVRFQRNLTGALCRTASLDLAADNFEILEGLIAKLSGLKPDTNGQRPATCQEKSSTLAKELKGNNVPAPFQISLGKDIVQMEEACKAGNLEQSEKMYVAIHNEIMDVAGFPDEK